MVQMVRGAATLPHGSGKVVRVAVFAEGAEAQEAIAAGADVVGADDLIDSIKESGGKLDFDKCIATPSFMPRLGKVARILGPRGLMPNPKVSIISLACMSLSSIRGF
jgi:ribosomal protein L1